MQVWEEGAETENDDKTCEGEGSRNKGRWILQPSVKTHKRIIQCSSPSFPGGKRLFFLDVRLAASTGLALLPKGFPLHSHGQRHWSTHRPSVHRMGCAVGAAFWQSSWAACLHRSAGPQRG